LPLQTPKAVDTFFFTSLQRLPQFFSYPAVTSKARSPVSPPLIFFPPEGILFAFPPPTQVLLRVPAVFQALALWSCPFFNSLSPDRSPPRRRLHAALAITHISLTPCSFFFAVGLVQHVVCIFFFLSGLCAPAYF